MIINIEQKLMMIMDELNNSMENKIKPNEIIEATNDLLKKNRL